MAVDRHAIGRLDEGTRVEQYAVRRWLGYGHCGDVYEAVQLGTGRLVALKLAHVGGDGAAEAAAAIRRETSVLAQLAHPAIVPLIDAGNWRDSTYVVLSYARGGSLLHRTGAPWLLAAALRVLAPVAGALDTVHAHGIVHRDVCARNVLLDGADRPWLADFSIAVLPGEAPADGPDVEVNGTPEYIAPELVRGTPPSPASDRYALGVLAYLLLCGVCPITGDDPEETVLRQIAPTIRRPSSINPLLSPDVDAVLFKALAPDPADRYPSAVAFIDALAATTRSGVSSVADAVLPAAAAGPVAQEVERLGDRMAQFAHTLPPAEQAALVAILRRAEANVNRAQVMLQHLTNRTFGPAAALLALEQTGVATRLATAPATAADLARAGAGSETMLRLLLEYLAQRGVLTRADGRFALPPELALLYAPARGQQHPVQAAWTFWSHLPARVGGAGPVHTMDTELGAVYERTVDTLADLYREAADHVARLLEIGQQRRALRVLDVGAGSGVWSCAMARRDPELRVTALDRPRVLEVTRRYAQEAGTADRLVCLTGDMHTVELPDDAFDLVILANVLHLEPGERIFPLLTRVRHALSPGGEVAVIDVIPARSHVADEGEHLVGLHLALRTPAGKLHAADEYEGWLRDAGFRPLDLLPVDTGAASLSVLLAARE